MDLGTIRTSWRKYCTLLGAFFIILPTDFPAIWGNVSVYAYSYIWQREGVTTGLETPWTLSIFIIALTVASNLGVLMRSINNRIVVFLGIVIFQCGMFSFSWVMHFKPAAILVTVVAVVVGFGVGILVLVIGEIIIDWLGGNHVGSGVFFVFSSSYFGISLLNPPATIYINPDNIAPTVELGHLKVFKNADVIDRAPSMFLIIGGITLFCHVIGFLLLKEKGQDGKDVNPAYGSVSFDKVTENAFNSVSIRQAEEKLDSLCMARRGEHTRIIKKSQDAGTLPTNSTIDKERLIDILSDLFKSTTFPALWFAFFSIEYSYVHLGNYYKEYGFHRIPNDHFLSDLSVSSGISGGLFLLVWGVVMDRFGVKMCLATIQTLGVICPWLVYFSAIVDKWFYLISVSLFQLIRATFLPTLSVAASIYFEKSRFKLCFGLILSAPLVTNLTFPPLFSFILINYGWYCSYTVIAVINFIGVIVTVLYIPFKKG